MATSKVPLPCRIDPDLLARTKKAAGRGKLTTFVEAALEAALNPGDPTPVGATVTGGPPTRPAARAKRARARATDQVETRFKTRDSKGN